MDAASDEPTATPDPYDDTDVADPSDANVEPAPAPLTLADVAGAPSWLPTPPELDEVELALLGVAGTITVHVPRDVADATASSIGLVLTDPEGTPLGLLTVVDQTHSDESGTAALTGPVAALQPPEHGPFRRLRRSASDIRAELGERAVVAVPLDRPLTSADTAAISAAAAGAPILLLPLIGAGSPRVVDATALVRIALEVAEDELAGALVVPVPLARYADADVDRGRRETLSYTYGAARVLHLEPDEATEQDLIGRLDRLESLDGLVSAAVAGVLQRAYRPPHRRGLVVLFTGLSGSGKSTIARAFTDAVSERFGRTVTLLDGDVVRRMLSAGLTFSRADRELNIRRIGFVAAEIARHGGMAVCCPIAPYASTRAEVRQMVEAVGIFVLIHVATPLAECERRDRKGLYAKARAGIIPEFTGISDPYEEPTDADLAIDTTDVSVDHAVAEVIDLLIERGHLLPEAAQTKGR